jgi:transcriptional regulator with PAS, ATPase and Fis domain
VLVETLNPDQSMQTGMTQRDKTASLPPVLSFASLGQAVLESFGEGVAVFDPTGRMVYANQRARKVLDSLGDPAFLRGGALRERLVALGGRARPLKQGTADLGEAIFLAESEDAKTLAERERQAILDTLEQTGGKLAETARRLGISRTTLWRRLRAYGIRPAAPSSPVPT